MIDFGVDASTFRQRYLEREPYLKRGAVTTAVFDWRALDEVLHRLEPTPQMFQLFHQGVVPQESYVDEVIDLGMPRRRLNKSRFYGLLQNGATLVMNRLEMESLAARHATTAVAQFLGQQTTSNAYMSFGGNGTFGKHWDTHDVFAIQCIGRKRWQVFKPSMELPLSRHTSTGFPYPPEGPPVLDCVLEPGDMLYLPRGWWHQVIPLEEASFHLSVGAYLPTVFDYLMWACNHLLPNDVSARRGIGGSADLSRDITQALVAISEQLRSPQQIEAFLTDLHARERVESDVNLGLMVDPQRHGVPREAQLRLTSYRGAAFHEGELTVNGTRLRFDRVSQDIVTRVADAGVITFARLCDHIPQTAADAIGARVLELAKHNVINIEHT